MEEQIILSEEEEVVQEAVRRHWASVPITLPLCVYVGLEGLTLSLPCPPNGRIRWKLCNLRHVELPAYTQVLPL